MDQSQEIPFTRLKFLPFKHQQHSSAKDIVCNVCEIPEQTLLFTDSVGWQSFWRKYQCRAPELDFHEKRGAVILLGEKTSGYEVEVERIIFDRKKNVTVIHAIKYVPDPERAYPANVVCPYEVVVFPSMAERIEFDWTTRYLHYEKFKKYKAGS